MSVYQIFLNRCPICGDPTLSGQQTCGKYACRGEWRHRVGVRTWTPEKKHSHSEKLKAIRRGESVD